MVFLQNKCGRLGNRLMLFAHFMANAIHYKYPLFNPTFDEYTPWFSATQNDDFGPYPISVGGRGRLSCSAYERLTYVAMKMVPRSPWHRFIRWDGVRVYDLNHETYLAHARSKPTFMFGWMFRDYQHVDEYQDIIRGFFTPIPEVLETVQRVIEKARQSCDVLVGIHVRRGDYREKNSRFCFSRDVYVDQMKQMVALLSGAGRRVGFLLCSDEPIDRRDYPGFTITPGPGSPVGDLYALSRCAYILGPPSTFSFWASFYGRVPRHWIKNPSQPISLEYFTQKAEEVI